MIYTNVYSVPANRQTAQRTSRPAPSSVNLLAEVYFSATRTQTDKKLSPCESNQPSVCYTINLWPRAPDWKLVETVLKDGNSFTASWPCAIKLKFFPSFLSSSLDHASTNNQQSCNFSLHHEVLFIQQQQPVVRGVTLRAKTRAHAAASARHFWRKWLGS